MKLLHKMLLALCLVLCPLMVLAEDPVTYLSSVPDVPLMDGFVEGPGSTLTFDKPEGRILSTYVIAEKEITPQRIFAFYEASLPQLGWTTKDQGQFTRDAEHLSISIEKAEDGQVVQFLLTPQTLKTDQ